MTRVSRRHFVGIEHTFRTTAGEHAWIVWRQYLREFAPLLWNNTKRPAA